MSKSVRGMLFLGLFVIVALPIFAYARKGGTFFSRTPQASVIKNSQTMSLLEAPKNSDPISRSGGQLAIVDNSALSIGSEQDAYIDGGLNGGGQISVYIVRKGDSLASIAKMFGVTSNTILWANDLKSATVKEGQELVILPVSGVRHVVKSGETLKSISTKYKGDVEDILAYNRLTTGSKLAVGDIVIVPNGTITTTSSAPRSIASVGKTVAGFFMRPVKGVKTQSIHGRNAVDIAAPNGTPVWASAAGTVTISRASGWNGGYGTYVVVSHSNGTQTLYSHMNSTLVVNGQKVGQGDQIGTVGNTGKSTGNHLHFEVRGAKNPF